jgi:hypothetical protein
MSGRRDESVRFRVVWSSNGSGEAATKLAWNPERDGQISPTRIIPHDEISLVIPQEMFTVTAKHYILNSPVLNGSACKWRGICRKEIEGSLPAKSLPGTTLFTLEYRQSSTTDIVHRLPSWRQKP